MAEYDLIIRGGSVIDGTGVDARTADIAERDGIIVEVHPQRHHAFENCDRRFALEQAIVECPIIVAGGLDPSLDGDAAIPGATARTSWPTASCRR